MKARMKMPALTVWQPWASLIVFGPKRVENRPWPIPKRFIGTCIAIHAGKTMEHDVLDDPEIAEHCLIDPGSLTPELKRNYDVRGAIIGAAIVAGCFAPGETGKGDQPQWRDPHQYGWIFKDIQDLEKPVFVRGKQGIWQWEIPDDCPIMPF